MIFDSLKNSALYYSLNPRLEKAFGFIASTDWEKMEPGIHELDGKDIYVNVMDTELKKPADAKLEIHNAYLDIQVLVRGERETFGWSERAVLSKPLGGFDAEKEVEKARKRFGETFDEAKYRETSPRVAETAARRDEMHKRFVEAQNSGDLGELRQIIVDCEIVCPISGTRNWTEVRQFNLMFSTQMGSTADGANTIYLRPETAQGIFVNFLNVQKTGRMKLPFGIAQIGKAFRNEIVARQFIFRMREFEQMEMQFFVRPGEEMKWWQAWKETRMAWHRALGFGDDRYRFHDHEKLAHYANAATDIEYNFPFGFKEVEGIHSRTDFDLGNHQKFSGRKIQYFDPETGESYVPYVVETSIGVDRMFLQVMSAAYTEEQLEGGDSRVVLRLPAALAPVKVAVLPLVKKDGMPEVAQKIVDLLKYDYNVVYDEKDSVGKRYRRQDAVGTPFCVTVDGQTLEDNTVTVRHRDTMQQERVAIDKLPALVEEECSYRKLFRKLNL